MHAVRDPLLTDEVVRRFWAKVDVRGPDECWPWKAATNNHGYGQLGTRRRLVYAHRIAGVLAGILRSVRCVDVDDKALHSCDNPPCCNPQHLTRGTQSDNLRDAARRGRMLRGERNHRAKLAARHVDAIRELLAGGVLQRDIARVFAVSKATVSLIARGKLWAWHHTKEVA